MMQRGVRNIKHISNIRGMFTFEDVGVLRMFDEQNVKSLEPVPGSRIFQAVRSSGYPQLWACYANRMGARASDITF